MKRLVTLLTLSILILTLAGCSDDALDSDLQSSATETVMTDNTMAPDNVDGDLLPGIPPENSPEGASDSGSANENPSNTSDATPPTKATTNTSQANSINEKPAPSATTTQATAPPKSDASTSTSGTVAPVAPTTPPPNQDASASTTTPPTDGPPAEGQPAEISFKLADLNVSKATEAQLKVITAIIDGTGTMRDLESSGLFTQEEITVIFGDLLPTPPTRPTNSTPPQKN